MTGQNHTPESTSRADENAALDSSGDSGWILVNLTRKWLVIFSGLAAVLLALSLYYGLKLLSPETPSTASSTAAPAQAGNASLQTGAEPLHRARVNPLSMQYEESLGAPLEETVKRLDFAIIQSMSDAGLDRRSLELLDVEEVTGQGQEHLFQSIRIPLPEGPEALLRSLASRIAALEVNATLERFGESEWRIAVAGAPTHHLLLAPPDGQASLLQAKGRGRLCIVIDDLGESVEFARELAGLNFPVTFAVWPRSSNAAEVAEIAYAAGRKVLVHQPMQPVDPEANPGPGALFTDMEEQAIRETVSGNIDMVPHAVGMNNHMGSAFTQDAGRIEPVLLELRSRGLFVLDSLTHPDSKIMPVAKRLGLPAFHRDVFLDVVRNVEAIVFQLEKAQQLALAKGGAVAIGHPHPETLQALKIWSAGKSERLDLVSLGGMGAAGAVTLAGGQTGQY